MRLKKYFILVFVGVFIFYYINKKTYETDYFGKLGINKYRYLYSEMINDFGNPERIVKTQNNFTLAIYDDLEFTFWSDTPNSQLMNVIILSKEYRFGIKSIGVGSSKDDILKAYKNIKRSPDEGYVFIDGDTMVEFYFEDGFVKEIMICYYN